jgi:hypothetical protein
MGVINTFWAKGGEMQGMPLIIETGLASADSLATLQGQENGRIELLALPRTVGLVAKSLDGVAVQTPTTLTTPFGSFTHCIQLGKTQIEYFAPSQPIGDFSGQTIHKYTRQWVQLDKGS